MKRILTLIIFVITISTCYSQNILDSLVIKKMLCKEWLLKSQSPSTIKSNAKAIIIFKPDHTYKTINQGNVDEGTWEIQGTSITTLKLIEKFTNANVPIQGIALEEKLLLLEFNSPPKKIKLTFEPK